MADFFGNLDWTILLNVIPALMCITIHELAHGYTAYKLGDPTAKRLGRLTLNPVKHIDPIGLLMMVFFRFGWAKPVPVDMRNFNKPKQGMAITALAGPLSNILLAMGFLLVLRLAASSLTGMSGLSIEGFIILMFTNTSPQTTGEVIFFLIARGAQISIALAVFNLLPIPPLDGSKILFSLLPKHLYYKLMHYERFGIILLVLFINTDLFSHTIGYAVLLLFFAPLYFMGMISPELYYAVIK